MNRFPFIARLFAIVDVWDALFSDHPYHPARTKDQAVAFLQDETGKHFDPYVVNVLWKNLVTAAIVVGLLNR